MASKHLVLPYAAKSNVIEKSRHNMKEEMVKCEVPLSLANFFYSFHSYSSQFANLFVSGLCLSNWFKFNGPEIRKTNDTLSSAHEFCDRRGRCCPKINSLPLFEKLESETALVRLPTMIIENHIAGTQGGKNYSVSSAFIP